jgi:class 3 adenylate cyclase
LTRSLDTPLVVGDALVEAIAVGSSVETTALLERLQEHGEHELRGRSEPVRIWTRRRPS